jgi:hypothetical protein
MAYATITLLVGMTFPRIEHRSMPHIVWMMSADSAVNFCSCDSLKHNPAKKLSRIVRFAEFNLFCHK